MTPSSLDIHCAKCNEKFSPAANTRKTFLGFPIQQCPHCTAKSEYPLTKGYKRFYLIWFALMIAAIIYTFSQGNIGIPGLIGICVCWALIKDHKLRKQLKQ